MLDQEEHRFGTCPWCGKHNTNLSFVIGEREGTLFCNWICNECLKAAQTLDIDITASSTNDGPNTFLS